MILKLNVINVDLSIHTHADIHTQTHTHTLSQGFELDEYCILLEKYTSKTQLGCLWSIWHLMGLFSVLFLCGGGDCCRVLSTHSKQKQNFRYMYIKYIGHKYVLL